MAESDPKKLRPFAQSPARRDFDSEDDPLVELARIVSEDSSFSGNRAGKPRPQPQQSVDRGQSSADLESELLQEIDRSFAPRGDAVPNLQPAPQAKGAPPARPAIPADGADDLLRSIEEQLGEFERRAQAVRPSRPEERPNDLARSGRPAPALDGSELRTERTARPMPEGSQPQGRGIQAGRVEEARLGRPAAPQDPIDSPPPIRRPRIEARFARNAAAPERKIEPERGNRDAVRAVRSEARPEPAPESPVVIPEPPRRRSARSGFAAGAASGWREIESDEESRISDEAAGPRGGRVELPRELRTTFGNLDDHDAPPERGGSRLSPVEAEVSDRLEPSYADPTFSGRWREADDPEPELASDAPQVVPGFGAASAGSEQRKRGKGLLAALALLAIVALGGGVAAYLSGGDRVASGPPPVIAAPEGAVKVAPRAAEQAEGETVGEAVYNRVAGTAPAAGDQLVDGAEEPAEISRIVPPAPADEPEPPPAVRAAAPEPATASASAELRPNAEAPAVPEPPPAQARATAESRPDEESLAVGPRRVRTFVVRPDGTIAAVGEAPPGEAETPAAPEGDDRAAAVAAEAAPAEPVRVATTEIDGTDAPPAGPVSDEGFDASPEADSVPPASEASPDAPPAPVGGAAGEVRPAQPAVSAAADGGLPASSGPADQAGSTATAEAPASASNTPILPDLDEAETGSAPATAAAPAAPPSALAAAAPTQDAAEPASAPAAPDGFVVQISSQRSEAQAKSAYAGLQKRFPSVLGDLQPNIQQADLGEKGVFFRVRVGPYPSRAEAIEVCEALQAAGGSCFVTR